jgi:hypothetical protein
MMILGTIASDASGDQVLPNSMPSFAFWDHMIKRDAIRATAAIGATAVPRFND